MARYFHALAVWLLAVSCSAPLKHVSVLPEGSFRFMISLTKTRERPKMMRHICYDDELPPTTTHQSHHRYLDVG
jgi:hypothetical protein